MNRWTYGKDLTEADQQFVVWHYVHRYTKDHKPAWARKDWKDGKPYPVQFHSDQDWLNHTRFRTRQDGRLDQRVSVCQSVPTWPNGNPEKETT